jgi:hypothetical protein
MKKLDSVVAEHIEHRRRQAQKRQVLACPVLYAEMARSERFELPTLGIEIRCSIQLSYERVSAPDSRDIRAILPSENQKQGWRRPSWPI